MEYKISIKDAKRFIKFKELGFEFAAFTIMDDIGTYVFVSSKVLNGKQYKILIAVDGGAMMVDNEQNIIDIGSFKEYEMEDIWGTELKWQKKWFTDWNERLVL